MANRTSSSPRRTHRFRPRLIRGTAAIIGVSAALILAACSGGSSGTSGTGSTASSGGVVTFAETPEGQPTWILPFYSGEFFTIQEQGWFESMMWPPLFNQANGQSPVVSYAHSLGNQPVYSDNGTVVTLTLKHWKWSDGKPITTRDIMFWLNLLKANKSQWADYTPGQFPDNVTSIKVVSPYEMVMHLDKSYGPAFFTGNELSQITPIPQHVWDKTSATGAVGNYDETPAGARAVMSFLQLQAKNLKTYATNPLWQTVYGPWKLAGYTLTGKVTFVPNKNYSGPAKPKISQFVEVPFTSFDAEYDALRAGDLTVGDIPANDIDTISEIKALGYNVAPWKVFGFNSLFINFNNPTVGPAFKQLYFRQALTYLDNQAGMDTAVGRGYSYPTTNGVPPEPKSQWVTPEMTENNGQGPYPYDPAKAKALLTSHGWSEVGGVMQCQDPSKCGTGITKGEQLKMTFVYSTGIAAATATYQTIKSEEDQVGIDVTLVGQSFDTIIGESSPCAPMGPKCNVQVFAYGGWSYDGPGMEPTGEPLFATGAGSNSGNYSDPTMDNLITETHTSGSLAVFDRYATYATKQLPFMWIPEPNPFQIQAVTSKLKNVTFSPMFTLLPEYWYFTR